MPMDTITAAEFRERIEPLNEREFTRMVLKELRENGWLAYHTLDSRKNAAGYPDIHAVHEERGESFYAELKMPGNYTTRIQKRWIAALVQAGHVVFVWYPKHWGDIRDLSSGALDL